jgi:capsular polysaccharide biosynthesis protein
MNPTLPNKIWFLHSAKLRRLLFGNKSLSDVASALEVLWPAKNFFHPQPVYENADLSRITGLGFGTTQAFELEQTQPIRRIHQPTVAYTVRDLLHLNGIFYATRFKHSVTLSQCQALAWGRATEIAGGVLGKFWISAKFFGRWLLDDIPPARLARNRGLPFGSSRPLQPQQWQYLDLFDAPLISLPNAAWVQTLEILQDSGINVLRIERWRAMRREFAGSANALPQAGVFLMRGSTGEQRLLFNELQVADLVTSKGFNVVNPGLASLSEVRAATANTKLVVGVEGSQLSHGLLGVADGGAMVLLQPPFRFNTAYRERCDLLGITYAFIVGHSVEGGFKVDLNALGRLLDRLNKHLALT